MAITSIQNVTVVCGRATGVCFIMAVPVPQAMAAPSTSASPSGWPAMACHSCCASNAVEPSASSKPSSPRQVRRSPNHSTAASVAHTGMV